MNITSITKWEVLNDDSSIVTVETGDYVEVSLVNCPLKMQGYAYDIQPQKLFIKETRRGNTHIHEVKKSGITNIKMLRKQHRKYMWTIEE